MSRTSFGVAAPASSQVPPKPKPAMPNRMPIEIGKAIRVTKLTPAEEAKLLEIGWQRGQPIPENLTDLMDQVRSIQDEATDVENLPPPMPLDTPPFQYDAPKEIDIKDLPLAEQEKYKKMMSKIFADAKAQEDEKDRIAAATPGGAGAGVAESIRKAMLPNQAIDTPDS